MPPALRLRAQSPQNILADGFRFRASAENDYFYRTEYSTDLVHWTALRTDALFSGPLDVINPAARGERQRFYRMVQVLDRGRPPGATVWRRASVTGLARSSRLYLVLYSAGDVFLDDIQLVPGTVAETGPNAVQNGDFESALSGPWGMPPGYAMSATSTEYQHTGNRSLHLVSTGGPINRDSIITQDLLPIALNTTHTLSLWYLPTTPNALELAVRLEDNSLTIRTNLLYIPPPF